MNLQSETHWARELQFVVPCRCHGIVHQILDGEAVLYDRQSGRTHRMNQTALWIWQACDGRSTTRQLAERLTLAYDVPVDRALDDIEQSIAAFAQTDLVTAAEDQ